MKIKRLKSDKTTGFTLIEMLLYIAIASTLILVVSLFTNTILGTRVKNQTINNVESQGAYVMQLLGQAIYNAESVNTPSTSAASVRLSLATSNASSNPTVFEINSGVLTLTEGASPAINLTNSHITISNLTFKNLESSGAPGSIHYSFDVSAATSSNRAEFNYEQSFSGAASLRK